MSEPFSVTFRVGWAQTDANIHMRNTAFLLRNEFFATDGTLAARVTTTGAWLDLATRKLTAPPEALAAVLATAVRTDDFEVLVPRSSKA